MKLFERIRLLRKIHRILGVVIGVQFLAWTISGLYFSWRDLDVVHGDPWVKEGRAPSWTYTDLQFLPTDSAVNSGIRSIESAELLDVLDVPYWWVNDSLLVSARTGLTRGQLSQEEALTVAQQRAVGSPELSWIERVEQTGPYHEFREQALPAWAIHWDNADSVVFYVDARNGQLARVRNDAWRWFDALWMFHTMDYATRDNFNNLLLRVMSFLGLFTVLSGLTLFFSTMRKRGAGTKRS